MIWPFSKKKKELSVDEELARIRPVAAVVRHLGYDITEYGLEVAIISLDSGYSTEETASHIVVVSLARDVKETLDPERAFKLNAIGMAVLENLKIFKDAGTMRPEIWQNDSTAIGKLIFPSPETEVWIDKILSDPVSARHPVATSRIL
ncbi:MAG: hypothetical protein JJ979_25330 [Roseibium sp.]|nr:hypothetical protein [Roseibium sp.]